MNKNAMVINKKLVDEFFFGLNEAEIEYVLIKNICEELPCNLRDGKDIDILVHTSSVPAFKQAMLKMNFKQIVAPYGIREGWSFGYQLNEYQFWKKNDAACNFFIDSAEKLMCKSLMPKMWIPIDNTINESIWRDKVFDTKNNWWSMDEDNVAAYLIIRSVFDKHQFSIEYITEIEKRKELLKKSIVIEKLEKVFFKFTPHLVSLIQEKRYEKIFENYIAFDQY